MSSSFGHIVKLDESVVNRIAAGEVVQRPSAAVKEMLENSLDAGSTSITVTAKGGGLQSLQIQDNGCGIRKEDLGIVCERFTTSKLRTFDDLKTISTFGFRGEALASITHVAHVTITTKTADSQCAYKAKYTDGILVPLKHGDKAEPKMCAGMVGTTIAVEDLFYNMHTRKQAFKNTNEQFQRILDVVTKYAIHYGDRKISFTCKKHGSTVSELHTPANSSTFENIKIVYGAQLARELIDIALSHSAATLEFSCHGKISNANFSSKKGTMIVFINDRLVDCHSVKKVIESVYAEILPKHTHPFVYLSISMPPEHVDVNVHPTKKEVHFMYEEEILQAIHSCVYSRLRSSNESRTFYSQAQLGTDGGSWMNTTSSTATDKSAGGIPDDSYSASHYRIAHEGDVETLYQEGASKASHLSDNEYDDLEGNTDNRLSSRNIGPLSHSTDDSGDGAVPRADSGKVQEKASSTAEMFNPSSSIPHGGVGGNKGAVPHSSSSNRASAPNKMIRTDASQRRIDSVFYPAAHSVPSESDHSKKRVRDDGDDDGRVDNDDDDDQRVTGGLEDPLVLCLTCEPTTGAAGGCQCCSRAPGRRGVTGGVRSKALKLAVSEKQQYSDPSVGSMRSQWNAFEETPCEYASVRNMLAQITNSRSLENEKALKHNSFVGLVDARYAAVQFGTKLLLLDIPKLANVLFYQLAVRRFGCMRAIMLQNGVPVVEYARAALDCREAAWTPNDGDKDDLANTIRTLLISKAEMLEEYFRIGISGAGVLTSIPELLQGYLPNPRALPMFIVRLACDTEWNDEEVCFTNICQHLGDLYSSIEPGQAYVPGRPLDAAAVSLVQNTLLPALQTFLYVPGSASRDGTIRPIAELEKLYRTFERC